MLQKLNYKIIIIECRLTKQILYVVMLAGILIGLKLKLIPRWPTLKNWKER